MILRLAQECIELHVDPLQRLLRTLHFVEEFRPASLGQPDCQYVNDDQMRQASRDRRIRIRMETQVGRYQNGRQSASGVPLGASTIIAAAPS
jgi:hypothetical protein